MEVLDRYESIVDDFAAFTAACERPLPSAVRVSTIKTTVERARARLDAEDITYDPVDWYPGLLKFPDDQPGTNWPYFHGWIYGQEEVSAVPAEVLDPEPGERVWDACAAPGSKTSQLAALMDDDGVVVATDSNLGRLSALRSNAERLGVTNVAVTHEDARNHSLKPFDNAEYDRALVDVPCSCEGTIRKNPDALDDWEYDHVKGISGVQKGVLRRAVQATKEVGPSSTRRVRSRLRRTRPSSTTSSRRRPAASSTSRYPRFGPRRHRVARRRRQDRWWRPER